MVPQSGRQRVPGIAFSSLVIFLAPGGVIRGRKRVVVRVAIEESEERQVFFRFSSFCNIENRVLLFFAISSSPLIMATISSPYNSLPRHLHSFLLRPT